MQTITDNASLRDFLGSSRAQGHRIGLVPTMGNLHAGHIRLVTEAKARCDVVATTIFVNPMQFGKGEDLNRYPRTPEQDKTRLKAAGCDLLFMPPVEAIYPEGMDNQTRVSVPGLSEHLCGASRPGHFDGVATVVSKLFNLVPAELAFFGEKDYQQLLIIRKLAKDLCFPHEIVGIPTVRESDGLAMSSRNQYLTAAQRLKAPLLYSSLQKVRDILLQGNKDFALIEANARKMLADADITPDYFSICNTHTLMPAVPEDDEVVILAAAFIGSTRLIDNIRTGIA